MTDGDVQETQRAKRRDGDTRPRCSIGFGAGAGALRDSGLGLGSGPAEHSRSAEALSAGGGELAIQVTDLTVAYRYQPVLWDIDLEVPSGVLLAIVGPNGAGKTTLMRAILGLVRPAAGSVRVFDRPIEEQRRLVGYVPQRGSVDWDFPATVLDTVLMGTYRALGWFRRPGPRRAGARRRGAADGGNGAVRAPADQPALRRSGSSSASSSRGRWCRTPGSI